MTTRQRREVKSLIIIHNIMVKLTSRSIFIIQYLNFHCNLKPRKTKLMQTDRLHQA